VDDQQAGQVRAVALEGGPRVVTFGGDGTIVGRQDLPTYAGGGDPAIVGGDYGTLVLVDENADRSRHPHARPYVLLTGAR
jgi:hypothetical protein